MALRFRDVACPKVHFGGEKVSSGELKAVFGVIEQDDRTPDLARRLAPIVREDMPLDPELQATPSGGSGHAIVIGYGRVGQVVCTMLDRHQFKYIAVDNDAAAVP